MNQQDLFFNEFRSSLRTALETALVEEPDDLGTHMAYADHLIELGDPRGEFIQVQLALEDPTITVEQRNGMRDRERILLERYQGAWLGPLAGLLSQHTQFGSKTAVEVIWRRGWVHGLIVNDLEVDVARTLVQGESQLRLLQEFRILDHDLETDPYSVLGKASFFAQLRVFQIGSPEDTMLYLDEDEITPLIERMSRLEELEAEVGRLDTDRLFALPMPHLRRLTVHHLEHYPLETLAENRTLTGITHLALWPHALVPHDDQAYLTREGSFAILRSPAFQDLTHLQFRLTDVGDDLIRELIAGGWLARLRVLDLWGGRITDAGATLLLGCPDARRLEALELSYNYLSNAALEELKQAGVPVHSEEQCKTNDDQEMREHLWHGDWE